MTTEQPDDNLFIPLGSYKAPALPTVDTLQALMARLRTLFHKTDDTPFIADDRLQRSTLEMLDDIVAPPACGPLIDELQSTLADWIAQPQRRFNLQLIVLPPGDENGVLASWARQYGHAVLDAPDRTTLLSATTADPINLDGDGVLVIPELERWFLRHRNGLTLVRALLARLDTLERRCVIGCNSWAWAFLCKAVGAHMILPQGLTFRAFDGARLGQWFSQLAGDDSLRHITFRVSDSGADVMAEDDDGQLKHDHFTGLAARSLGIPWVAWHIWRSSLRSSADADESTGAEDRPDDETEAPKKVHPDDEQTLWVVALEQFSLPAGDDAEPALLVLQALLIHGTLSVAELRDVVPVVGESTVLSALVRAGVVEQTRGQLRCTPAAYPAVRSGLSTAGFSMDRL
ncbi:hypothetical protein [Salinisphaera aquimarina]|uniref:MarR family transcriptional regulator n=1 Tax=Salinisphaera aquimarina TaxID=2094031 RepID=A0ABV7ER13_9GAMM